MTLTPIEKTKRNTNLTEITRKAELHNSIMHLTQNCCLAKQLQNPQVSKLPLWTCEVRFYWSFTRPPRELTHLKILNSRTPSSYTATKTVHHHLAKQHKLFSRRPIQYKISKDVDHISLFLSLKLVQTKETHREVTQLDRETPPHYLPLFTDLKIRSEMSENAYGSHVF